MPLLTLLGLGGTWQVPDVSGISWSWGHLVEPNAGHPSWSALLLRWDDIEPLLDKNMNHAAKEKAGIRINQTFVVEPRRCTIYIYMYTYIYIYIYMNRSGVRFSQPRRHLLSAPADLQIRLDFQR